MSAASGGEARLRRVLGRRDLIGLTVNSTIGAGILGLPGKMYALLGPYSVLACLAGGVLMGLVAACYGEASSRLQGTGGSYLYVREAFGPVAGFMTGWIAVATRLLAFASISNLAVGYAAGLLPAIQEPLWRIVAISVICCLLGAVIYVGVGLSARANLLFTLVKVCLLVGFVAAGLVFMRPLQGAALPAFPAASHWAPGIVLMLFGLIGLDSTVISSGEMRNPGRDLPVSLAAGIAIVIALYAAILLTCAGVVPDLAHSSRPIFDGAVAMLGPTAGIAVVLAALVTMAGTLFVILFVGPRMIFALSDGGQMPALLGSVHPRFRTPHVAVIIHTAMAWMLALSSSFIGALTASTLTRLILYALTAAALLRLRRQHISDRPKPLTLPGGTMIALATCALCIWLMLQSSRSTWIESGAILLLGAACAMIWGRSGIRSQRGA